MVLDIERSGAKIAPQLTASGLNANNCAGL